MEIVILTPELKAEIASIKAKPQPTSLRANVNGGSNMSLMYTSGTTGLPKGLGFGVARTWQLAAARFQGFGLRTHPNGDRWYCCMPLYHGTGGIVAVICMLNGVTLCIGKKFSTRNFWTDVRDSNATMIVYVGEVARYLLAAPPTPDDKNHSVRVMYGNGLRPDVWGPFQERFGIPEVAEFFNSTEGVFGLINYSRGEYFKAAVGHHGAILRSYFKNTYVPVETHSETGDIVRDPVTGFAVRKPYEEGGEMIVAVPDRSAFPGYYNNAGATSKKFVSDVFKKGDLWYRSGDALRRTSDGHWYFLDRLGDTFRWKSENVSTAEVSEVLGKYPGVIDANVYGVLVPAHDGRAGCAALHIAPELKAKFDYNGLLA
jgi:acyl-CoA synthetase (AMP-forming)/AMP-acid ligase II